MVRIDMSEYMEKFSVSRLVGAPPGYVGYEEGGQLTEAVRRRPYQVVLLDEIEKAHPDVFNVLLQVLDDGRLTDGQGRTVDFKNTVVIMTSNIGSAAIAADAAPGPVMRPTRQMKREVTEALRTPVPAGVPQPDRRGHRLPRADRGRPGADRRPAARPTWRGASPSRTSTLELTPGRAGADRARGHRPAYGARPLKRTIQRLVENPLARALVAGEFRPGDRVTVDADLTSGTLVFSSDGRDRRHRGGSGATPERGDEREAVGVGGGRPGSSPWTCRRPVAASAATANSSTRRRVGDMRFELAVDRLTACRDPLPSPAEALIPVLIGGRTAERPRPTRRRANRPTGRRAGPAVPG